MSDCRMRLSPIMTNEEARQPRELLLEFSFDDEGDFKLFSGPFDEVQRNFESILKRAHRAYYNGPSKPIEPPRLILEWDVRDAFDPGPEGLSIIISGARMETSQEAAERWHKTEEYAREYERLAAAEVERKERELLARLQAKYQK